MNYLMIIALFNLVNAIVIYQKRIQIIMHPRIYFTTSGMERRGKPHAVASGTTLCVTDTVHHAMRFLFATAENGNFR